MTMPNDSAIKVIALLATERDRYERSGRQEEGANGGMGRPRRTPIEYSYNSAQKSVAV
jgi:hypothetical protein